MQCMDCIIQNAFEQAVSKYGNNIAIEQETQQITFHELNLIANKIATRIRSQGIKQGTHIGILQTQRINTICSILGILKAGCVFVPIDNEYPLERIQLMIDTADVEVLLYDEGIAQERILQFTENVYAVTCMNVNKIKNSSEEVENERKIEYSPNDKIYIYFSSGTTGKPKAVLGQNNSLLHFVQWEIDTFHVLEKSRISQLTSPCHDPFLRDIFVPLLAGGTVCIPENKEVIITSSKLLHWINKSKIQMIHCTPSLFRILNASILTERDFTELKYVFLAGEKVQPWLCVNWYKAFGDRVQLVNLYGPTETTLAKTYYMIKPMDCNEKSIPIGKPIDGCKVIILDNNMNICNIGEIGEIYIRTPYMSLGYYKNDELNAQRFIQNPFTNSKDIIFKTGDVGILRENGNIEFVGRKDRQIKIRGYRVELEEIEREMNQYPGIQECITNYHEAQDLHIETQKDKCVICGIPSYFPGIELDNHGVCNKCKFYEDNKNKIKNFFGDEEELKTIFQNSKQHKKSQYDCLLLYSGGKDSTYALCKLVEYGLNVLAYTFDNGYISKVALENIKYTLGKLKVDYIIDSQPEMNKIFLDGLKEEVSVCNGCFKVLREKSTLLAYEKNIKYIVTGFSRGQLFDVRLDYIFKMKCFGRDEVSEKIFEQRLLYHSKEDYVTRNLNNKYKVSKEVLEKVELIDYYQYSNVTKDEIMEYLKLNCPFWSNPKDTGVCSSNCLINDVGIYLQRKVRGYDNYTSPTSWELRLNHIGKENAIDEVEANIDTVKVKKILEELNYSEDYLPFDADYSYIIAYYVSEHEIEKEKLREYLEKKLPEYMIPSNFIRLDSIPLTANGKVDYTKLPLLIDIMESTYTEPSTETERKVADIFKNILKINHVSSEDGFLKVGGNSLNIMSLIAQIYQVFNIEITLGQVFADSTVKGIAEYINTVKKSYVMPIVPVEKKEYYPLSSAQTRMLLASQMENDHNIIYNTPMVIEIKGSLNLKQLELAFNELIERHEGLRTSFKIIDGAPVQQIHDNVKISIVNILIDASEIPEDNDSNSVLNELEKYMKVFVQPFNLETTPLFRVEVLTVSDTRHYLLLDIHHIISDGTSLTIFIQDLLNLYDGKRLQKLSIQYKDYSEWQNKIFETDYIKTQKEYWLNKLSGKLPVLNLPMDYARSATQSYQGDSMSMDIGLDFSAKINEMALETGSTEFIILLTAFNILLWKYSGQEDIIIGTPTAGRNNSELDDIMGVFINTIPLRNYPQGKKSFHELLLEIKNNTVEALENQDYQFEKLVENLDIEREAGRNILFDTMLIFQNMEKPTLKSKNLEFVKHKYRNRISKYDFTLIIEIENNNLEIIIEYCTELYKQATIRTIITDYINVIKTVMNNPNILLRDIQLDSELHNLEKITTDVKFDF